MYASTSLLLDLTLYSSNNFLRALLTIVLSFLTASSAAFSANAGFNSSNDESFSSNTLIMWYPNEVFTTSDVLSLLNAYAASLNSLTNELSSLEDHPKSPPLEALAVSLEFSFASVAKSPPSLSFLSTSSAFFLASSSLNPFGFDSLLTLTRMWAKWYWCLFFS